MTFQFWIMQCQFKWLSFLRITVNIEMNFKLFFFFYSLTLRKQGVLGTDRFKTKDVLINLILIYCVFQYIKYKDNSKTTKCIFCIFNFPVIGFGLHYTSSHWKLTLNKTKLFLYLSKKLRWHDYFMLPWTWFAFYHFNLLSAFAGKRHV